MFNISRLRHRRSSTAKITVLVTSAAALLAAHHAAAANKFWDTATTANLQAGNGTWDTGTTALWSTATTGSNPLVTWADNDAAMFQSGGTSVVDLGGATILATSLANTGGSSSVTTTTLNNGTLRLTSNTGISNTASGSGQLAALTINSAVLLDSANVGFSIGSGTTTTITGSVAETGGVRALSKTGAGTLLLNGANSFTGGTTISNGLLRFGTSGTIPTTGVIAVTGTGVLAAGGPGTLTAVNAWLDSGLITAASTGALAITGNNSEAIDFSVAHNGNTYSNLYLGSTGTFTYSGALTPSSSGYLLGGFGTLTVSSALNAATSLTVGGSGTLVLSSANGYTGVTTVGAASILQITNGNALGTTAGGTVVTNGGTGTVQLSGGITVAGETITINGTGINSSGALSSVAGNNVWTGNVILGSTAARVGISSNGNTFTISGVISDGTGNAFDLAIRNASGATGTVVLSGANTYHGNTQIVVGTLQLGANQTLPMTSVLMGNNSAQGTTVLDLNGHTQSLAGLAGVTGNSTSARVLNSSATPGSLILNTSVASSNQGSSAPTLVILGNAGGNNFSLTKTGSATYTLFGAHSYTGATTVNAGTLSEDFNFATASSGPGAVVADDLSNLSTLTLGGGTFQLKGRADGTATSLTGASWATGARTITVGSTANLAVGEAVSSTTTGLPAGAYVVSILSSTTFLISANTTVAGSTATVSAVANSATTTQTLNGLTLTPGASTLDVSKNGGDSAVLDLRSTNGTLGIARGIGSTVDFKASSGTFGTDAVVKTHQANDASGILGGYATVAGADFAANNGSDVVVAFSAYSDVAAQGSVIADGAATNVRLNSAGSGSNIALGASVTTVNTLLQNTTTAAIIDTAGGTLRLGAIGGLLVVNGKSSVTFGTSVGAGNMTAGGADNTAGELIFINNAAAGAAGAITVNSTITDNGTGSVSLTKSGTGDLALAGAANTYTGKTTLNGGVTKIVSDGSLGVAPGAPVADQLSFNGGTLQFTAAVNLNSNRGITLYTNGATVSTGGFGGSYAGAITGSGPLTKSGAGTWTLSGASDYAGATTVSAGTLAIQNGSALGSSAAGTTVAAGATLGLQNSINVAGESLTISGDGDGGSVGALRSMSGNNTWGGAVTVATGAATNVRIATDLGSNLTISGDVSTTGTGTFVIQGDGNTIVNGSISGSANLTRSTFGAGAVTLGGTNTYSGATTVSAGSLIVSGSISGTTGVSVANGATLGGGGTLRPSGAAGTISVLSGGIIAPGNTGIGTLTIDSGVSAAAHVLSLTSGAKFTFELNTGFQSDTISLLNGSANDILFGGNTINFTDLSGGNLAAGTYTLFTADTANAYSGLGLSGSTITSGLTIGTGLSAYSGGSLMVSGNNIVLVIAVPEPASGSLLAAGFGMALGLRRFRRRK